MDSGVYGLSDIICTQITQSNERERRGGGRGEGEMVEKRARTKIIFIIICNVAYRET